MNATEADEVLAAFEAFRQERKKRAELEARIKDLEQHERTLRKEIGELCRQFDELSVARPALKALFDLADKP